MKAKALGLTLLFLAWQLVDSGCTTSKNSQQMDLISTEVAATVKVQMDQRQQDWDRKAAQFAQLWLPGLPLDLARNACLADWMNDWTPISPCDPLSSARLVQSADLRMEDGLTYSDVLIVQPVGGSSPMEVEGQYPPILIQPGYHFRATVGCAFGQTKCDLGFTVAYQASASVNSIRLGSWRQVSDGALGAIDLDLSRFAGQTVALWLRTEALAAGSTAGWISPRIAR